MRVTRYTSVRVRKLTRRFWFATENEARVFQNDRGRKIASVYCGNPFHIFFGCVRCQAASSSVCSVSASAAAEEIIFGAVYMFSVQHYLCISFLFSHLPLLFNNKKYILVVYLVLKRSIGATNITI